VDDTLIIKAGFNGPRLSGNGGYVSGLLAERYNKAFGGDGAVEITLRAPIPIETRMNLVREDAAITMRDGDTLICEARVGKVDHLDPPKPPSDWNAVLHQDAVGGCGEGSDFQWCLVCGRSRGVGDGLRVFGSHSGSGTSLSCYVPHANHADGDGRIRPEFLWGTLDCPGAWAAQDPDDPGVLVLSKFAGAANQMGEALIVNPNSPEEIAEALKRALTMDLKERVRRWRALNEGVQRDDVTAWRDTFVNALAAEPHTPAEGQYYGEQARPLSVDERFLPDLGAERRGDERAFEAPALRDSEARGEPAALRLPSGTGRGLQVLGGDQGTLPRPARP